MTVGIVRAMGPKIPRVNETVLEEQLSELKTALIEAQDIELARVEIFYEFSSMTFI